MASSCACHDTRQDVVCAHVINSCTYEILSIPQMTRRVAAPRNLGPSKLRKAAALGTRCGGAICTHDQVESKGYHVAFVSRKPKGQPSESHCE